MKPERIFSTAPGGTIRKLRAVLKDEYCNRRMNKSVVTGFLGEMIVGRALSAAGHAVEHLGRQHGTDLRLPDLGVDIDVKTSLLKHEFGTDYPHWGWALISGSKNKDLNFSHVVCVGLDEALEADEFFVIRRDQLDKFPPGIPPFKNNRRILILPRTGHALPPRPTAQQKQVIQRCVQLFQKGIVKRVSAAGALLEALTHKRPVRSVAA